MLKTGIGLRFPGTCEKAFNFYKSVFGGEFIDFIKIGDDPYTRENSPKEEHGKVAYIAGCFLICALASTPGCGRPESGASARDPIIDVHLHAFTSEWAIGMDTSWWPRDLPRAGTTNELISETVEILERHNIVKAIASSDLKEVELYQTAAPDRIIPSLMLGSEMPLESIEAWHRAGRLKVLGEVVWQYEGLAPNDPTLGAFWALAEKLDLPVGLHMGLGPPGEQHAGPFRMRLSDPLLLEEVLVRHPRARVYVMHAGWPMLDHMVALLYSYPTVYVDVGVIDWYIPRAEFHAYLRRLVDAGFGKRIMFGSDQMQWPAAIPKAIDAIETATFLNQEQKRDIFCNNAATFFRLEPALCEG